MKSVAVSFTNFGPYHLARLGALAASLRRSGVRLVAIETASAEGIYPWETRRDDESFGRVTLFPESTLEEIPRAACVQAMRKVLIREQPDAVMACGYARPESMAMLRWAAALGKPSVLMSESQAIDHPRVWWKEAVKRRRVRRFSAALVGGPAHVDYLVSLGMPAGRVALGYNAVDGNAYAAEAAARRRDPGGRAGLPERPYFLAVNRFAPEKNLVGLVEAYATYRRAAGVNAWDLVLCGDGPAAAEVDAAVAARGLAGSVHRPGFLQAGPLARWYAFASAFVHPSLMEPWGLVVNEAAACGLPLLVSDRAGAAGTFVPVAAPTTGRRLDPTDVGSMARDLAWVAGLDEADRRSMGARAAELARLWGPERFARGAVEALQTALVSERLKGHYESSAVA